jgi:putative flippase GtrA
MKLHIAKHRRKIDFLIIGGLNTVVGLTTFPALYFATKSYQLHYMIVLAISQVFCVTVAFFTNKYFVFRTKGNHLSEYLKFSAFYSAYFVINLIVMPVLVEIVGMNPVKSQILISIGIIISSYFWHSTITFSPKK